jgi:hypothetical protein
MGSWAASHVCHTGSPERRPQGPTLLFVVRCHTQLIREVKDSRIKTIIFIGSHFCRDFLGRRLRLLVAGNILPETERKAASMESHMFTMAALSRFCARRLGCCGNLRGQTRSGEHRNCGVLVMPCLASVASVEEKSVSDTSRRNVYGCAIINNQVGAASDTQKLLRVPVQVHHLGQHASSSRWRVRSALQMTQ